ncbi:hypothetical protein FRB97_007223 [Tulasnella sp. 331]|nr:hypothetical protein FRB97_007223 [Tulasnella sp. 331]
MAVKAELDETGPLLPMEPVQNLYVKAEYRIATMSKSDSNQQGQPIDFTCAAYFPWDEHSIPRSPLYENYNKEELQRWRKTVAQWRNVVAVCGGSESQGQVLLFRTSSKGPFELRARKIFHQARRRQRKHVDGRTASAKFKSLVWAVDPQTLNPVVIVAGEEAVIRIWDVVTRSMVGTLKGHGGIIHSLAVHPANPFIFASTSRDMSIRIYSLALSASSNLTEATWPITSTTYIAPRHGSCCRGKGRKGSAPSASAEPTTGPINMGTPHGGSVPDGEGSGIGKCFVVLRGHSSYGGGHQASVLDASFHATRNFIATCGVDNSVKIWRLPSLTSVPAKLTVEDKPVFSASTLHESLVNSVYWLSVDTLASRSCGEGGTLVIWKWTEIDRFTPWHKTTVVRAAPGDYEESRAFIIHARTQLPEETSNLCKLHVHVPTPTSTMPSLESMDTTMLLIPISPKDIDIWHADHAPVVSRPSPPILGTATTTLAKNFRSGPAENDSSDSSGSSEDSSEEGSDDSVRASGIKRARLQPSSKTPMPTDPPDDDDKGGETENGWKPDSMLGVERGLDQMASQEARDEWSEGLDDGDLGIHCIAMSTSAEWVVAAGKGEMLVVWKNVLPV